MSDFDDSPEGIENTLIQQYANPLIHGKTPDTLSACNSVLRFVQDAIVVSDLGEIQLTASGRDGLYYILQGIRNALDYECFRK